VAGGLEFDVIEGTPAKVGKLVIRLAGPGAPPPKPPTG
jgi:hypothetical protein